MPPRPCSRLATAPSTPSPALRPQPTRRRPDARESDPPPSGPPPALPPSTAGPLTTNHAGELGLARSFELVKVELFSVPAHAQVPSDVDVARSARAVLGTAKRLATLVPDLAKLGGYDLRPVRRLRLYAGTVLYTHILALAAGPADLHVLAMRDAAYVLFLQAYHHVRHGVMLLRWAENDAGLYLPPLCRRWAWGLGRRHDERAPREERKIHADGTVRLEAAAASPGLRGEVPMG